MDQIRLKIYYICIWLYCLQFTTVSRLQMTPRLCSIHPGGVNCSWREPPSLCIMNRQSIRITSTVNGTGTGTLVVCGKHVTEHLTIMAGNDEIFPSSTWRYEVTVSDSGYHSTVNITVHNLTEEDQGVIPLVLFTCCMKVVESQIWVDLKGRTDQLKFRYQLIVENHVMFLTLQCEADGYPRSVEIRQFDTNTLVINKTFSTINYQPTMLLEHTITDTSCLPIESYICEVEHGYGNYSTSTLHVTHAACSPRLLDVMTNNSVIVTNINDTVLLSFNVISSGDITVDIDSTKTEFRIIRFESRNCFNVNVFLNSTQESDIRNYTITIELEENKTHGSHVMFTIQLKARTVNDSSTFSNRTTQNTNSSTLIVLFLVTFATTTVILVIALVCLVTHYKKMNRCTARFRGPTVHYDKCYFNDRETYRNRYMNVAVTPLQDGESYRPSSTLELSNLQQYSEVQDVQTLTNYSEPTDTQGHQQSETHTRDVLTLYAHERHYSVVDVQDSLAPSVGYLNQSAKAIEDQLTSQQVEPLNDDYITPIDHYSTID